MAGRKKSGGIPRKMKLEAMSREKAGKPPKISAKLPALPTPPKKAKAATVKGVRTPTPRIEKYPKVSAPKTGRRKRG